MTSPGKTIAIIGAGPAGMLAALLAAERGAQVTLFDSNPAVGRKLLVTGAGRCNLTNANIAPERYACADAGWLAQLFTQFGRDDLLGALAEIGVLASPTWDGWYYPRSESAATVVDAFAAALQAAGVRQQMNTTINGLKRLATGFDLASADGRHFSAERVILAAGGTAYPTLGSRGECLPVLARLGHTIIPMRPALAPVLADVKALHSLQGVRLDVTARLFEARQVLAETTGNLIFTQWGFNGPAVMDLSHHISARPGADLTLELDLLPGDVHVSLLSLIQQKRGQAVPLRVMLGAVLPPKVALFILAQAGLLIEVQLAQLSDSSLADVLRRLQSLRVKVTGVRGFEYCQVSAGGVPLDEVDPQTMQSRRVPGLYLAGEILDVTGPCGGYNLQFAFSSGAAAGRAAAS